MTFTEQLLLHIDEANKKFGLFSAGERVLVGFSGGADSLALLDALHGLLGENVYAFHVNHMLRGTEADGDELFCRSFCEQRGISFCSKRIDVAALSRELHGGGAIEETARDARYAALAEESRRVGAKKIALAHTASDNAETVLFNLARGTALAGLRGIPPKRAHADAEIIRPIILCTREEIEGYCRENGMEYRTDATNADVHYTRNFIRHKIIPLMKEINPALCARISATSEALRADEDFISGEAKRFMAESCGEKHGEVAAEKLMALHKSVRRRVLRAMYAHAGSEQLEEKHFADVEKLLASGKEGARIILPGKIAAVLKNGALYFTPEANFAEESRKAEFYMRVPRGACDFDGIFATVLYRKGEKSGELGNVIAEFSENAVFKARVEIPESTAEVLRVRNRENRDTYVFGGMTRTIKKLLTGGTETAKKKRPVFCDRLGIFWFPAFRLRDDVYAAEEKTYILHYFEYEN